MEENKNRPVNGVTTTDSPLDDFADRKFCSQTSFIYLFQKAVLIDFICQSHKGFAFQFLRIGEVGLHAPDCSHLEVTSLAWAVFQLVDNDPPACSPDNCSSNIS